MDVMLARTSELKEYTGLGSVSFTVWETQTNYPFGMCWVYGRRLCQMLEIQFI